MKGPSLLLLIVMIVVVTAVTCSPAQEASQTEPLKEALSVAVARGCYVIVDFTMDN